MKTAWQGKTNPTVDDFKPFIEVRKEKAIPALLWLCEHNYTNRSKLIISWSTDGLTALPLQENTVKLPVEEDFAERGTYAGDMEGLTEDDFHRALRDMADGAIVSGAVCSDVEGQQQNPGLKMVLALMDLINKFDECPSNADHARETVEVQVITWKGNSTRVLMNDYEDSEYFTSAFHNLFPYGRGGLCLRLMNEVYLCHWKPGQGGHLAIVQGSWLCYILIH
jgi:hypothetical protein